MRDCCCVQASAVVVTRWMTGRDELAQADILLRERPRRVGGAGARRRGRNARLHRMRPSPRTWTQLQPSREKVAHSHVSGARARRPLQAPLSVVAHTPPTRSGRVQHARATAGVGPERSGRELGAVGLYDCRSESLSTSTQSARGLTHTIAAATEIGLGYATARAPCHGAVASGLPPRQPGRRHSRDPGGIACAYRRLHDPAPRGC